MTNQSKYAGHTPGPWNVESPPDSDTYISGDNYGCNICTMHIWDAQPDEQIANANRIVACVNACEGIENPAADIPDMRTDIQNANAMIDRYEVQKTNLLADNKRLRKAVKARLDADDTWEQGTKEWHDAVIKADNALRAALTEEPKDS